MTRLWHADPWGYRLAFVALALVLLFLRLLPLGRPAGALPGPDMLLCLMIAWMMRRPDFLPVWLIAPVVLLEDFLLMRPPGLWTALVVMATEFLRSRIALTRELNFLTEWLLASGLIVALMLGERVILALTLLPQVSLGPAAVRLAGTILAYPLIVGASRLALGLRKPGTGEVDERGRRL